MQNKHNIEALPDMVMSGEITRKEAARIIWEDVYMNPMRYGLIYFSEDQKSDFLLSIQDCFESLFEKFNPGQVTFRTFIAGCIAIQKNSFLRNQMRRENERRSIDTFLRTKTEEDCKKYAEIELPKPSKLEISHDFPKNFDDVIGQDTGSHEKKRRRVAELTALVLMMKACKDIDDDMVSAVSDFTQVDKTLLYDKIQELKQGMSEKSETYKTLVRRRNNAFFFHRKYMQEMLSPSTTERQQQILRKKYEGQTKRWKKKNESLSAHSETPSNEEIARTIGIKPRMVSFYINHARQDRNLSRIRRLYLSRSGEVPEPENDDDNHGAKVAEDDEKL